MQIAHYRGMVEVFFPPKMWVCNDTQSPSSTKNVKMAYVSNIIMSDILSLMGMRSDET